MKLLPIIIPLAALFSVASAFEIRYDPTYDNAQGSMSSVACSDGANGLSNTYHTFGDLPSFPHIGAAQAVEGWNSPECGSCWRLSYKQNEATTATTIYVTAIDQTVNGFTISEKALKDLGGDQALAAGHIDASATQVNGSYCGF